MDKHRVADPPQGTERWLPGGFPVTTRSFGFRIGAGFAAILLVSLIGYAVGLNTTADLSEAMELLRRTEQVAAEGARVQTALDSFETHGGTDTARRVDEHLATLHGALRELAVFVHRSGRESSGVVEAKRWAESYQSGFDRLQELERSRHDDAEDI